LTELTKTLRLRVFAGPNGSGKSTVIHSVRQHQANGYPIDFGVYVNADDIAKQLRQGTFSFQQFGISHYPSEDFLEAANRSGLLSKYVGMEDLKNAIRFEGDKIILVIQELCEQVAQIVAECLRTRLLADRQKFSFETVFSHRSKIEFIQQCAAAGYKVYLYFVGTSSPDINKFRVQSRVNQGGHAVPEKDIVNRYYRSMDLLWEAAQNCYQVFFFDNSSEGKESLLFAHFKVVDGKKDWTIKEKDLIPDWFKKYYAGKTKPRTI
jgi:predicted ABC-type ATPase